MACFSITPMEKQGAQSTFSYRLASVNRVMDTGAQYCIDNEVCYVAPLHELDEQESIYPTKGSDVRKCLKFELQKTTI